MSKTIGMQSVKPPGEYSSSRKQIKKMGTQHEAILNWLIENPTTTTRDCAEYFGVQPAWIRSIVSSDAFQLRLAERQDAVFHTVVLDLREKLHGAAHEAIDRLVEKIKTIEDPALLLKAVDTLFDKLGYTGKTSIGSPQQYIAQQNTTVVIGSDQLEVARDIMAKALTLRDPIQLNALQPSPPPEPRSGEEGEMSDES